MKQKSKHGIAAEPLRRFSRYSAYKASGVDWLGEVPEHWEVKRLKTVASVELSNVDKKSLEGEDVVRLCNYTDVYYNSRITGDLDFMVATATAEQVRKFTLHAGDVLITKDSESWTDIAVSAVVAEDLPGVLCGYHLAHIRPGPECDGAFLSRAFAAIGPRDQFQIAANGVTRFGLGSDAICTSLFAIPPVAEQRAIAAFLDREAARIDAMISKKQRLIELLEEQRIAVINRAVTKGLEPNIPTKDSGVEWLGEIPAQWGLKSLKRLASLSAGAAITAESIEPIGEYPVFGGNGVRGFTSEYTHDGSFPLIGRQGALCGCVNFASGKFWASEHAVVAESRANVSPKWLGYVLQSMSLNTYSQSAAQPGLSIDTLSVLPVPAPSIPEQVSVANFLDQETAKIQDLIASIRDAINSLHELRTALISAAVTGQIDLRGERA